MINFDLQVREFPFNSNSQTKIEGWRKGQREFGSNWPVVYFIHNETLREGYIGETLNAGKRAAQHWQISERQRLSTIHIMTDESFNKSVILDLESFLIKYISADGKYKLQNGNNGLNDFDYYGRKEYEDQFQKVWEKLRDLGLVQSGIADIQNSDLFKYSPYKALNDDQTEVLNQILYYLNGYLKYNIDHSIIVEGGAGTGKTILAVFLIKLLTDIANNNVTRTENEGDLLNAGIAQEVMSNFHNLKIGFVVPMQSLRQTIKKVFRTIDGLSDNMILSPNEIVKKGPFDLLVVDEAHRLHQRKALSQYPAYDKNNKLLGLPKDATELDWILKSSKVQVLFYDQAQSVKPSDIPASSFMGSFEHGSMIRLKLQSQLRCLGGDDYIQYVKKVLNGEEVSPHGPFENYRIEMFDNVDSLVDEINRLDKEYGLSCTVAGYAWPWITKNAPKDTDKRDITIGKGYIWNRSDTDWINSDRLPYEVGCIHTVQGYDLNYVGVIFGPEVVFDPITRRIEIIKDNYKDSLGRAVSGDIEALRTYILNIYCTLLTRGIRGAFIYACDPKLQGYLRRFFG